MVSKASEDLPEPLNPVITVKVFRGISTSIFFRLCCRAPCTVMRFSKTFYFLIYGVSEGMQKAKAVLGIEHEARTPHEHLVASPARRDRHPYSLPGRTGRA